MARTGDDGKLAAQYDAENKLWADFERRYTEWFHQMGQQVWAVMRENHDPGDEDRSEP